MMNTVLLAFLIGSIPSISMTIAPLLLKNVEFGPKVEACFQNFAAGLILAAVAVELVPQVLQGDKLERSIGVTIGFIAGLCIVYGIEYIVDYLENLFSRKEEEKQRTISGDNVANPIIDDGTNSSSSSSIESSQIRATPEKRTYPNYSDDMIEKGDLENVERKFSIWENDPVERAKVALAQKSHRDHLKEHTVEMMDAVKMMEGKCDLLLEQSANLSVRKTEEIAETIDEEIHLLHYKLDHCRRLLQGSEVDGKENDSLLQSTWITEDRKLIMKKRLLKLKLIVNHIVEHIQEPDIDKNILQEIHDHLDDMDKQIGLFHESLESVASKWTRLNALPETSLGDKMPLSLIIPVAVDCFVDGFLIGLTTAISWKAAGILAFANFFEMGFLGLAYASRIMKCTGSSTFWRNAALYLPPLLMLCSAGVGASVGSVAVDITVLYIAFVTFGVVALLFLVCNELLIEARNSQDGEPVWWVTCCIFVGIYAVIMV